MGIVDRVAAASLRFIPRPVVRGISRRYIAGDTLDDAVEVIRQLNAEGCKATVDELGEETRDRGRAAKRLGDYKRILDALVVHELDAGISVKLTGLGLSVDERLCRSNLEEITAYAAGSGHFVRVDMESSLYTAATLDIVCDLRENHENTGAVLQACLRRSHKDATRLAETGTPVRLCKGIYDEPRRISYKDPGIVRENYVLLLEELLRGGSHVAVATHDEYLIWHALRLLRELGVPRNRYEFQMLLGVDEELRRILVDSGYRMRVYVPFGEEWYEYSTRRLKENPKLAGYVAKDVVRSVIGSVKS